MDIQRAKEVLTGLAEGIDPLTGEVLPRDSVYNTPEIIRALYCAINELSAKSKKPQPENAGKPWTEADDTVLCQMFDEGKNRREICAYFKRSEGAIASRLARLGKIQKRDDLYKK